MILRPGVSDMTFAGDSVIDDTTKRDTRGVTLDLLEKS